MSVRSTMIHRCQVERDANADLKDDYNNPLAPDWYTLEDEQPCYYYQRAARQTGEYRGRELLHAVVIYAHQMLAPLDADITPQDRVYNVVDRRDESVADGRFNVLQVLRRPTHQLLVLESVE